ncbi:MAG TPA: hypothetical protein ENK88_04445 [Campylobacterales bacterium]|nr:hypothetical protein [Campylobacterales bacterium]
MSAIKDYSEFQNVGFQKELKDIEMEELERDLKKSQSNLCKEILSKSSLTFDESDLTHEVYKNFFVVIDNSEDVLYLKCRNEAEAVSEVKRYLGVTTLDDTIEIIY